MPRDPDAMTGFKPSGFKSSFKPAAPVVEPVTDVQSGGVDATRPEGDGDVDGEELAEVDGEPMDDVDGAPMDDVDGEEMGNLDGQALDDDLDGEAL